MKLNKSRIINRCIEYSSANVLKFNQAVNLIKSLKTDYGCKIIRHLIDPTGSGVFFFEKDNHIFTLYFEDDGIFIKSKNCNDNEWLRLFLESIEIPELTET